MNYFYYNTDDSKHSPPRYPILIEQGFASTGGSYDGYGEQLRQLNPGDILLMYRNGVGLVAVGRVTESWDGIAHPEPRYYPPEELRRFESGTDEYRIAAEWFLTLPTPIPATVLNEKIGFTSPKAVQKIGKARAQAARFVADLLAEHGLLPGEIESPKQFFEGAVIQRLVNTYERNSEARVECVAKHGTACVICGFDFGKRYGSEFTSFIHVHHLVPLSKIGQEYQLNPATDLVPVCPNCHAVIHYGGQLRSPDDVKKLMKMVKDNS